MHKCN